MVFFHLIEWDKKFPYFFCFIFITKYKAQKSKQVWVFSHCQKQNKKAIQSLYQGLFSRTFLYLWICIFFHSRRLLDLPDVYANNFQ